MDISKQTVVRIEWSDSSEVNGWIDKDNLDGNCRVENVTSVGFLVKETDECVSISNSFSEHQFNSPLTIPKFAIKTINHV